VSIRPSPHAPDAGIRKFDFSIVTALAAVLREDINFLITNRIPRRLATRFMGWFSRVEQPFVRDLSLSIWQRFADLRLDEASTSTFASVHDCFTRSLKDGARPIEGDHRYLVSPCDAILGAGGRIRRTQVLQAKGMAYSLEDLLGDGALASRLTDGTYATLRLTANMYHRFHAPAAGTVRRVTYISGDTWNVNPIALARVERLFCRNERAIVHLSIDGLPGGEILLVAVGAILVGSIRLHCLPQVASHDRGIRHYDCDARYARGEEMGWFEHGSTIIVLAPRDIGLVEGLASDARLRMGERLLALPSNQ
jgi:phosphatidylserine decarboxylase